MNDVKLLVVLALEQDVTDQKKHVFLGWYSESDDLNLDALAHDIAKENFAKLNSESLSYVDYKFSTDEYILVSYHNVDKPDGISIVKLNSTYYAYKEAAQKVFIEDFNKDISNFLSNFAPGIKFYDKTLPTSISINYNSEYDDNNYYTDIESIDFLSSEHTYYTSQCHAETNWDEVDTLNIILREYIKDNYNIAELELYVSSSFISLNLKEPLEQELLSVSSLEELYKSNSDKYSNVPYYKWNESLKQYIFTLNEDE